MLIIFRNSAQVANERTRPFDRLSHNHPILDISFNQAIAFTSWIVRINLHRIRGVPRDVHDHFDRLNRFLDNWGDQLPWAPEVFFSRERQDASTDLKDLTNPETGHDKVSGSQGSDQHNPNYYIFSYMEIRNRKLTNHKVHSGCNL